MKLTDTELETLNDLWLRDDYDGAVDLLEAIVAARLARVEALADELRATRVQPAHDIADMIAAALAAPAPDEVGK